MPPGDQKMKTKSCEYCKETFEASRKTKRFCGASCSNKYHGEKRKREGTTWNLDKASMKECDTCHKTLAINLFSKIDKWGPSDSPRKGTCKKCSHMLSERERRARDWRHDARQTMLTNARQRSKRNGRECTITKEDIVIPEYCPVLGIKLEQGGSFKSNSPSLDRIDNSKGYIRGNVIVVSNRANSIKRDATIEELSRICSFYGDLLT